MASKIKVQIGEEVVELKGQELEDFNAQREASNLAFETFLLEQEQLKQTKVSAYTKLGLTEDEINAIIGAQ